MAASYSFELELERADLAGFGRYLARMLAPTYTLRAAFFAVIVGFVIPESLSAMDRQLSLPFVTVAVLVSAVLWAFLALAFWNSIRRSPVRMDRLIGGAGPFRITIGPDGILREGATSSTHQRWPGVLRVVERNGLLILMVSRVGGYV